MDLSYEADIDTLCVGCGNSAAGWAFASDGRRVYVCRDCATAIERYTADDASVEPHPRGQFCRSCDRLTRLSDLTTQRYCPDCVNGAGERAEREATANDDDEIPPEVAAARADAEGAIDWDESGG